jgi:hypothetical protein
MAYVQRADRAFPQAAIFLAAAVIAGLVVTAALMIGELQLFGGASTPELRQPSQAVLQSEAMWLEQRLAEGGYIDPATRSAREWEDQRRQQSGE